MLLPSSSFDVTSNENTRTAVVEYIHTQFHYIVINEVVINKRERAGACARDGKGNIALCVHCIVNTEPLLHMLQ